MEFRMKKTGYTSFALFLFSKLTKLILGLALLSITSCDYVNETRSYSRSLLILKIDKDQNFSFNEINEFKDFFTYDIEGIEPFNDSSFVIVLSRTMQRGLIVSHFDETYKYDAPRSFPIASVELNSYGLSTYNMRSRIFIDNSPSDTIYTFLPRVYSSIEIIRLHYQDDQIKKKQSYFLPNKIIGDSLYCTYWLGTQYPPENLIQLTKKTYKIVFDTLSIVSKLTYLKEEFVTAQFPENSDSEIILLDELISTAENVSIIYKNEQFMLTSTAGYIYCGTPIEDGFLFQQIGEHNDYLGADDYAIYFNDHLYDFQKRQNRPYPVELTDYNFESGFFTLNDQFYVAKFFEGNVHVVHIDRNSLSTEKKITFNLTAGGFANILSTHIRGVTLKDGSTHFLLADYEDLSY